jgi:sugar (pentulose or hexulose) kinase
MPWLPSPAGGRRAGDEGAQYLLSRIEHPHPRPLSRLREREEKREETTLNDDYILAIDNGTQSVRALLFDARGHLAAKAQIKLAYQHPRPGWMECDPEQFWRSLCAACRQLWATSGISPRQVRGLVVTTQRATVINLDRSGQPLRPAIIWADQRRAEARARLSWWWEAAFGALRLRETIRSFEREAEINWIAQNQPETWKRTDKYLLLSGYLHYRFTGRFVDSVGNQVGYLPFDFKHGRWAGRGDWKWQCLPVERAMLPELVPCATVIGKVGAAAAADTGIPEGLPVVAGASDKACEVLGSGCLTPDVAGLSYGTTATINTTTARYLETTPFIPPYPAALPGYYSTEVQITRGYWMVSWFAEQFGLDERRRAEQQDSSPEAFFDDLLKAVPPGSHGLVLQPYWNPGVKVPGPEARGGVIGFTDTHTRAHLYRAIIEGLAYALREGKERIERRSGTPITKLRVAGGGSQSNAAMQITADVFNLPAERPSLYEASGLGAAILGSVALGLHKDFDGAVREMTRVGRRFEPNAANARLYDRLYHRVYLRMYERLQPLYRELQSMSEELDAVLPLPLAGEGRGEGAR